MIHVHDGKTDRFTTSDGLSSNSVVSLFQDREGNIWAGTSRGLDKFSKPAVPSLTIKQGLSNDYVNSVLTDRQGVTWIGTRDGLNRLVDGQVIKSSLKLPIDRVTSLFETSEGRLLVATDANPGVVWVDGNKATPLKGVSDQDVFEVSEEHSGDLWIATLHSGVQHLHKDGTVVETFDKVKLGKRNIGITFDPKRDGLWLVSALGGLQFIKDGKVVERYNAKDGLGDGIIRDPQVDKDGGVWMGTRVGLAHLMNGKIAVLSHKNGLPCDAVHWMRQDRDHSVWLYTECGLVEFSENELSSWISQPSHVLAIKHYFDNTDGVESVAYNGWYTPQVSVTKDGRILFATTGGLSVVDPHNLNQNISPPPVHIEEITADEREVSGKTRVSLPIKVRSIRIAFTALSFVAPRKVLFRYKLEGFDKDWSSPASLRQATYTNLSPGNYKFQVIACNNDGVWNRTGDTIDLYLPPAFYQTIWFRCLIAVVVACTLWLFYVLRLRRATAEISARLGERLQERERIARALHDTLLQDFQAVILRFQIAANRLSKGEPSRRALDEGLDYADKVLAEGRNHIRDIRADSKSLEGLVEPLTVYGQELSGLWPLKFAIVMTGEPFQLYPVVRDEMYRIGREAIGNAFKHSNGSEVAVEVLYTADALILRIGDDGQGMEADIVRDGRAGHWGINNMRERAQKIGATLNFSKLPDFGTCVELKIALELANGSRGSWFKLKWRGGSEKLSTPTHS